MDAAGSRSTTSLRWTLATLTLLGALLGAHVGASVALGAGYRTANFTVDAPNARLAREIGDAAEAWRSSLAMEWLGEELPDWAEGCPIKARVGANLGAGGETSFVFDQGEVFGWRMKIQGSRERILDSVLPHEVTHTIFASHFRQPLPRWADEGACTTVEHESEIAKQEQMLIEFLHTRRGIPFSDMFAMREYPRDVMPLYAQGHALAEMLIAKRGRRAFLEYLADGMRDQNWPRATRDRYGYPSLLALQSTWLEWVRVGRPQFPPDGEAIAQTSAIPKAPAAGRGVQLAAVDSRQPLVYRGQDPGALNPRAQNPDEHVQGLERSAPRQAVAAASTTETSTTAASTTAASTTETSTTETSTTETSTASPYEGRRSDFQPHPNGGGAEEIRVVTTPWQAVRSKPKGIGGAAFNALRDTGTLRR